MLSDISADEWAVFLGHACSLQETSVVGHSTIGMGMLGWFLLISFMNHKAKVDGRVERVAAGGPLPSWGIVGTLSVPETFSRALPVLSS